jgi:PilZ domain
VETLVPEKPIYSRRFSTRIEPPERVCVYWTCADKDDVSLVRNLSIGGLFIATPKSHCLGATAKLDFLVSDGQIRAEAVIRHSIPRIGFGLRFTALVKEDRPHLAALMARLRGASRVRLGSPHSQLKKNTDAVIDLTNELRFEE